MGARPMARAIDNPLRKSIAKQLLVDKTQNGCKIKIRKLDNGTNLLIRFGYSNGTIKEIGTSEQSERPSVNT